jgi:hypothetical protein
VSRIVQDIFPLEKKKEKEKEKEKKRKNREKLLVTVKDDSFLSFNASLRISLIWTV